ncbi:MAG: hypothetical protein U0802_12855 [Candidatus Binatia bacterium]
MLRYSRLLPLLLIAPLAACGGPSGSSHGGVATTAAPAASEVVVTGHVATPGTKGPLLVFAQAGTAGDAAERETLSVAAVDASGDFTLTLPPTEAVSFAFLADGANDGVIDGGDPIAVLSGPALSSLGGGETVVLGDVALDFTAHKAMAASIDVQRAGAPPSTRTPTPVPAAG